MPSVVSKVHVPGTGDGYWQDRSCGMSILHKECVRNTDERHFDWQMRMFLVGVHLGTSAGQEVSEYSYFFTALQPLLNAVGPLLD